MLRVVSAGSGKVRALRRLLYEWTTLASSGTFQRPMRKGVPIWTLVVSVCANSESCDGTPRTTGPASRPYASCVRRSFDRLNRGDQVTLGERLTGAGEMLRDGSVSDTVPLESSWVRVPPSATVPQA